MSPSPLLHNWFGNEPASGAGVTHFQGNVSPIWQSTWLQHGKGPGAPHATPAQRLRPLTSPREPLLPARRQSQLQLLQQAETPARESRRDTSHPADTTVHRCSWHVPTRTWCKDMKPPAGLQGKDTLQHCHQVQGHLHTASVTDTQRGILVPLTSLVL